MKAKLERFCIIICDRVDVFATAVEVDAPMLSLVERPRIASQQLQQLHLQQLHLQQTKAYFSIKSQLLDLNNEF